jgi:hypothetical protein
MEGLTLVGLFMEGTILTCLETYSDAKKKTLGHVRTQGYLEGGSIFFWTIFLHYIIR